MTPQPPSPPTPFTTPKRLDVAQSATPSLARRMACFMYEGVLLFGVLMIGGYLFSSLTQQRHALIGRHGLQAFSFLLLGIYFVWFWSRSGQTVAMKAWHIRVLDAQGRPLSQWRATMRYLASWTWFFPALLSAKFAGLHSALSIFTLLCAGVVTYAALSRLHPQRQFWHDAICGTKLVHKQPPL